MTTIKVKIVIRMLWIPRRWIPLVVWWSMASPKIRAQIIGHWGPSCIQVTAPGIEVVLWIVPGRSLKLSIRRVFLGGSECQARPGSGSRCWVFCFLRDTSATKERGRECNICLDTKSGGNKELVRVSSCISTKLSANPGDVHVEMALPLASREEYNLLPMV